MGNQDTMDDGPSAPFRPDEAWIDAFAKQCTDEMQLHAQRYATRRAQYIARAGGHPECDYGRTIVQDVISDTLTGKVAWEPSAKSLHQHTIDTIKYRTRNDRVRARRYQVHRIDAFGTGREPASVRGEYEASLAIERGEEAPDAAHASSEMLACVRREAAGDKLVLAFVDAVIDGALTRTEIRERANLTFKQYRTARERLQRMMLKLEFVEAAPRRA